MPSMINLPAYLHLFKSAEALYSIGLPATGYTEIRSLLTYIMHFICSFKDSKVINTKHRSVIPNSLDLGKRCHLFGIRC